MTETYIAFLRGINVGGYHKVPMAELRKAFETMGFKKTITLLNTGNIIFDAKIDKIESTVESIQKHLENYFGFPIPVVLRKAETIVQLIENNPFQGIELTKEMRFYISFLKKNQEPDLDLPWTSPDQSFKILEKRKGNILSVLDLAISKTPKAMAVLEKNYGKDITTRNWNTVIRITEKLHSIT